MRLEGRSCMERSIGATGAASTRRLPGALPEGAPCDNVGIERDAHCGGGGPNIVKDGTPQIDPARLIPGAGGESSDQRRATSAGWAVGRGSRIAA
jgi:hypothetical protein